MTREEDAKYEPDIEAQEGVDDFLEIGGYVAKESVADPLRTEFPEKMEFLGILNSKRFQDMQIRKNIKAWNFWEYMAMC